MKKTTIKDFWDMTKEETEELFGEATKRAIKKHHDAGRCTSHADAKGVYKLYPDGRKEYVKETPEEE